MNLGRPGSWIVLGGSSAVARAFAREAAARGSDVILAGRDRQDLEQTAADLATRYRIAARVMDLDAAVTETHEAFVEACWAAAKPPRQIFLAFAAMPEQEAIDGDVDLGLRAVGVTYLGAVSLLHRFARRLAADGEGRVVILGSVAGDRGRIKNYVYGSAKAGLHAYAEGLRARLWRSGVSVTLVKPGFLDTTLTWGRPGVFLAASPEACARACLRWADRGAETRYFPSLWWPIMAIIRAIPDRVFKRLSF